MGVIEFLVVRALCPSQDLLEAVIGQLSVIMWNAASLLVLALFIEIGDHVLDVSGVQEALTRVCRTILVELHEGLEVLGILSVQQSLFPLILILVLVDGVLRVKVSFAATLVLRRSQADALNPFQSSRGAAQGNIGRILGQVNTRAMRPRFPNITQSELSDETSVLSGGLDALRINDVQRQIQNRHDQKEERIGLQGEQIQRSAEPDILEKRLNVSPQTEIDQRADISPDRPVLLVRLFRVILSDVVLEHLNRQLIVKVNILGGLLFVEYDVLPLFGALFLIAWRLQLLDQGCVAWPGFKLFVLWKLGLFTIISTSL